MPCVLEVTVTRIKSTSRIQCNRSVDQNIDSHFSEVQLIHRTVSVCPHNRNNTFALLFLGHNSDRKLVPFFCNIQEINKTNCSTSGAAGSESRVIVPTVNNIVLIRPAE